MRDDDASARRMIENAIVNAATDDDDDYDYDDGRSRNTTPI